MKIKLAIVLGSIIMLGCGDFIGNKKTTQTKYTEAAIEDITYERRTDSLLIYYRIKNVCNYDIWICDGIFGIGEPDLDLETNTLFIKLSSDVPLDNNMLFTFPPLAYYSKLSPGCSVNREIDIKFPLKYLSAFRPTRIIEKTHASGFVLQVGYITSDERKKLRGRCYDENEAIFSINMCDVQIKEKFLKTIISNVSIPIEGNEEWREYMSEN